MLAKQSISVPEEALTWSPAGKVIATGGEKVRLWRGDLVEVATAFPALGAIVRAVAFSPDGKLLAAGDASGRIRLHDAATGAVKQDCEGGHDGPVHAVAWHADGKTFLSLGEEDGKVCLWSVGAGKPTRVTQGPLGRARGGPRSQGLHGKGRFSPDRKFLASRHSLTGVEIREVDTGRLRGTLLLVPSRGDKYLAASADGDFYYTGDAERDLVFVVRTDAGQDTLAPSEFAKKYGRKNDPEKVRLTAAE